MDKIVRYLFIAVILYSVSSCIKDDPKECPPQYTIKVSIKDKNYLNVAEIPQLTPVDETMAFGSYVSNIYYSLKNMSTGQIYMESSLLPANGNNQSYNIEFQNIPHGQYELDVWANVEPNTTFGLLHNNNNESTDIYLGNTILNFTSQYQQEEMMLERRKGMLLVLCNNFPSTITDIEETIDNVYQSVNSKKEYSGVTTVTKTSPLNAMLKTVLAPSAGNTKSKLNLKFISADNPSNNLTMPEVEIDVNRNEISAVSVDYNDFANQWEIRTLIDGTWTLIHQLGINDN